MKMRLFLVVATLLVALSTVSGGAIHALTDGGSSTMVLSDAGANSDPNGAPGEAGANSDPDGAPGEAGANSDPNG